jgi:hypothetical protein
MFEHMQTALQHRGRKMHSRMLQGFQQLGDMFCCVGKIQDTHCIRPMPLRKRHTPVCSIHDGSDLFRLPHPAPSHLHFCQISKGRCIREPRKIRERAHMDLSFSLGVELLLWLPNGDGARFYPLFLDQRNHRPIGTDDAPLRWFLLFWLRLTIRFNFRCLRSFHPAPNLFGESADRFLGGLDRDDLFHHLSDFVEGHEAGQVYQMFLLTWGEIAWQ